MKHFYEQSVEERRAWLMNEGLLDADELLTLAGSVSDETASLDRMSENVIGAWRLPLGLLRSLNVDGVAHCVPMATEESSVVAAVNRVSRLFNAAGGVSTVCRRPSTTVQIMFSMDAEAVWEASRRIVDEQDRLMALANAQDPVLLAAGGGAYALHANTYRPRGDDWCPDEYMIVVELDVYTMDAMGANIVNTMGEAVMNDIERMFAHEPSFRRGMAIVSNDGRDREVQATIYLSRAWLETFTHMDGIEFGERITRATAFAMRCEERAITHNKGIMNGIEAAALAFGQDTRAIHAAAWYRANGKPLATWQWNAEEQILKGQIALPLVVGIVGKFRTSLAVQSAFKLAGIDRYETLCGILAAVGLAQNFGALWALVTEGIQSGHMRLHARK